MIKTNLDEYRITVKRISYSERNSYSGLTLLYVLKGEVEIITTESSIKLKQRQIFLINKNETYTLVSHDDNALITLEIANSYIIRYYPLHLTSYYFLSPSKTHSTEFENGYINDAIVLIAKITVTHIQKSIQYLLDINRLLSELLLIITSFCCVESTNLKQQLRGYSPKIEKTIQYIKSNYNQKISLQQIAKNEYISFSHLSRLFKKEVGIGFIQYVNQIKFESTLNDLINTTKKVYQIAEDHGFTGIKQFISQFKKQYGATPTQFRKNHQLGIVNLQKPATLKAEEKVDLSEVIYLLSEVIHTASNATNDMDKYNHIENQEVIIGDSDKTHKLPHFHYTLFVGAITELLKHEVQQQIRIVQKEITAHYVEVCDLITDDFIYPEFKTDEYFSTYNRYVNADTAINFLYQNNIAISIRVDHETICQNISAYTKQIASFLTHCTSYFDLEYIKRWRFIYAVENISQLNSPLFEKAYNQLFNIIKELTQAAALGIFYSFNHYTHHHDRDEVIFKKDIMHKVDFVGYSASFDENSLLLENEEHINHYADFISHKTSLIKKSLQQNQLNKPLYLMQWNTLTGNTRKTNGRFFRGALLLKTLLDLSSEIKNITLILNTDTQKEVRANHIDTSSIALFLVYETRRPIFFILKFLQKLKGKIIRQDKNILIMQNGMNYQVLITNLSIFNPYLSIKEHLLYNFKCNRLVTIRGIPSGLYQVKRYLLDQDHGALYRQYEKFQTQYGKNEEVFEYLAQLTKPDFSIKDLNIDVNNWQILTKLDINAIDFYELHFIE